MPKPSAAPLPSGLPLRDLASRLSAGFSRAEPFTRAAEWLDRMPSSCRLCPHGLEVFLREPYEVGVTVGFPLTPPPLLSFPSISQIDDALVAMAPPGVALEGMRALLQRVAALPPDELAEVRNVFAAFEGEPEYALAGPVLGFQERNAGLPPERRWELLLGDALEAYAPTLDRWARAQRGQPPPVYVGAASRAGRRVVKAYTRAPIGEQLDRQKALSGASVLEPGLESYLRGLTEREVMRAEDWVDGELVRLGVEISLRWEGGTRSIREGLQGTALEAELDPFLLDLMDRGEIRTEMPDRATHIFGIDHLKISVGPDPRPEWKIYLVQHILPPPDERARAAVRGLFG